MDTSSDIAPSISVKKKLAFSALAFVLFFASLELGARALSTFAFTAVSKQPQFSHVMHDRVAGWTLTPHVQKHVIHHSKRFDVVYRTNDRFRVDTQPIGSVAECSVALVGDSHIFGFGLPDKDTLAVQLHERLSSDAEPVYVLNAGVIGYGPGQYYLRLKSLDTLKPGALVVVFVNPINDIVNLSSDVAYQMSKPYFERRQGKLVYTKPVWYDPGVHTHFGVQYARLNGIFGRDEPAAVPPVVRMSERLSLLYLIRHAIGGTLVSRWAKQRLEFEEVAGDPDTFGENLEKAVREDPSQSAADVWPTINEFAPELDAARETLTSIFSAMREVTEGRRAHLLVVVPPEFFHNLPFARHLMDIVASCYPEYTFDWDAPREAVRECAEAAGVDALMVTFPPDRMESLFVQNDSHISGEGFSLVADQILDYMCAQDLVPVEARDACAGRARFVRPTSENLE